MKCLLSMDFFSRCPIDRRMSARRSAGILLCGLFFLLSGNVAFAQHPDNVFDAAREGNTAVLETLLKADPGLADSTQDGSTPLLLAAYYGHAEAVAFLAPRTADVDQLSSYGTALMGAAVKGHTDLMRILLENGADSNATDRENNTALTFAAMFQHEDAARLLTEHGADPTVKNHKGFSPADYAAVHKNTVLTILFDQND